MAAAVTDATGVVIRDLPLTPERVWRHIQEDNSRASGPVGAMATSTGPSLSSDSHHDLETAVARHPVDAGLSTFLDRYAY